MGSSTETRHALYALAARQGGYFTARQALAIGHAYAEQSYHVTRGNWERVAHGVYRLCDYPETEHGDLIILSLMSHDRADNPQIVFSHETALALHELGDANPARIHLTALSAYRRTLPAHVIAHRAALAPEDWEAHDGYRVTTPLRTLRDIAASPTAWPFLDAAVADALRRGMVRRGALLAEVGSAEARRRLRAAVERAGELDGDGV